MYSHMDRHFNQPIDPIEFSLSAQVDLAAHASKNRQSWWHWSRIPPAIDTRTPYAEASACGERRLELEDSDAPHVQTRLLKREHPSS